MQLTELVLLLILPLESLLFIISVANKEAQNKHPTPNSFPSRVQFGEAKSQIQLWDWEVNGTN